MADSLRLSLPALSTQYKTVPRRYEESKPVAIQGFAHVKILGLGNELHRRTMEKAEQQKCDAIEETKAAVWQEAEHVKEIALIKAREEAAQELEKMKRKLKKVHEKELKEEALKVEMAMQKLAIERVKEERIEAEKALKAAVLEMEEICYRQKLEAVAEARRQEALKAAKEAKEVARQTKAKYDALIQNIKEEHEENARITATAKELEKVKAVYVAEERERRLAKEAVNSVTRQFEAVIEKLRAEITEQANEIKLHLKEIESGNRSKDYLERCLLDTRRDFQDFIDRIKPFQKGQAEFVLPPLYLDELEKKGYTTKSLR